MIRKLTRADSDAYKALRLEALQTNPESYFATYEEESRRDSYAFGAEISNFKEPFGYFGWFDEEGKLRAYVQISPSYFRKTSHVADIYNLYVDPSLRRQGVARQLFDTIFTNIRNQSSIETVFLTVMHTNHPARKLYESMGFSVYGIKENSIKSDDGYLSEVLMRYDVQR